MAAPQSLTPVSPNSSTSPRQPPAPAGRPLRAEIDLDAIAHNLGEIRRRVGNSQVLAVVKANAYGHGAVPVARACLEAGASYLGVACVDEGVQLRRAGISAPILVLAYSAPWEAGVIVREKLTAALAGEELAAALAQEARTAGVTAPVHIEVDTGMARFGVRPEGVSRLAAFVSGLPELRLEGVYTHFAIADEADKTFTRDQFQAFLRAVEPLPRPLLRHAANSAAVADLPEMASFSLRVNFSAIRYSAQAMKSVKVLRLLSILPFSYQARPISEPPRMCPMA